MTITKRYVGPALEGFDHGFRPTRGGKCDTCGRDQRVRAHGFDVKNVYPAPRPRCGVCGRETDVLRAIRGGVCTDCARLLGPIGGAR